MNLVKRIKTKMKRTNERLKNMQDKETSSEDFLSLSDDLVKEEQMISINSDQKDLKDNDHNSSDLESNDMVEDEKNEEIKPSVRKLSLFDTLEDGESEKRW